MTMLAVANPTSVPAGIPYTAHPFRPCEMHGRIPNNSPSFPAPASTNTHACAHSEGLTCTLRVPRVSAEYRFANSVRARVRSPPAKLARPTCFVHRMCARVRSATASSSSPPYSIRGLVFRRGVRRGLGNFAGDPSVPSDEAHGAPPGQGPLHRTPAYPRTNNKPVTECRADAAPTRRPRASMAVRARARHAGFQTYDGRVFAHLLHRAEKPAL